MYVNVKEAQCEAGCGRGWRGHQARLTAHGRQPPRVRAGLGGKWKKGRVFFPPLRSAHKVPLRLHIGRKQCLKEEEKEQDEEKEEQEEEKEEEEEEKDEE